MGESMKLILTTHGSLCTGLLQSYEMIAGKNEDILSVPLTELGIEAFRNELLQLLESIDKQEEILILTDIKGGTPFNESFMYALTYPERVRVISGVNLPMLIEVGLSLTSFSGINEAAEKSVDIGKLSIENMFL